MPHRPGHVVDEQGIEISPPSAPAPPTNDITSRAGQIQQNIDSGLSPSGGPRRIVPANVQETSMALRNQLQRAIQAEDVLFRAGGTPAVPIDRNLLALPESLFTQEIERTLFNLNSQPDAEEQRKAQESFLGRLLSMNDAQRAGFFESLLGAARDPGQATAALSLSALQQVIPGEQQLESTAAALREQDISTELAAVLATHNAPSGLPFGVVGTTEVLTDPLNILGAAGARSKTARAVISAIADPTGGLTSATASRLSQTSLVRNLDPRLLPENFEVVPVRLPGGDPTSIPGRRHKFTQGAGTTEQMSDAVDLADETVPTNVSNASNPPSNGGVNQDLHNMFNEGRQSLRRDWPDTLRLLNEALNERFYKIRSTLRKEGQEFLVNVSGSSYVQAQTRYNGILNEIRRIAPRVDWNDIDSYAHLKMAENIFTNVKTRARVGVVTSLIDAQTRITALEGQADFSQIEQAATVIRSVYRQERERLVDAGILTRQQADILKTEYPWYNPIHYADFVEAQRPTRLDTRAFRSHINRDASSGFNITGNAIQKLGQKGISSNILAPSEAMFDALVRNQSRINRNGVSQALIDIALDSGMPVKKIKASGASFPDSPGTMSFLRNGTQEVYQVPDWMWRQSRHFSRNYDEFSKLVGAINGVSRFGFTTVSLPFMATNMMVDMLTVWLRQGIGPHRVGWQLLKTAGRLDKELDEVFGLAGGRQFRFFGSPSAMSKRIRGDGGKVASSFQKMGAVFRTIPAIGDAVEQAPRKATFQRSLDKSMPDWRERLALATNFDDRMKIMEILVSTPQAQQAASDALESTINFWRGGFLIKQANPFILFMNAAMEGFKLPFRTLASDPWASVRLGGLMAGYTGIQAYNMSYPEYFDIPNDIRWGSILVMLPPTEKKTDGSNKANYITVVPRTREWALFFGSQTYMAERLLEEHPIDAPEFLRTVSAQTLPINSIPNVQVLEELTEQFANHDFYRDAPIIPPELDRLPSGEQFAPWTSETMRRIGEKINVSPIRLDHAFHGILGGGGRTFTSATDWIFQELMEPELTPEIQALVDEFNAIEDPTERVAFRTRLSPDAREAFQKALRVPSREVPVVGAIRRRFSPGRGGQLRRTGEALAQREFDVSSEQTRDASRLMSQLSDDLLNRQQQDDEDLRSGEITSRVWRDNRAERFTLYRGGLLTTKEQFPRSIQGQLDPALTSEYFDDVSTLGGAITDARTRAQLLANAWYAIRPTEIVTGVPDMDAFFSARTMFTENLSREDRALLDTYLDARRTDMEVEYSNDLKVLQDYFNIGATLSVEMAGKLNQPSLTSDYAQYREFNALGQNLEARAILERQYQTEQGSLQLLKLLVNVGIPVRHNEMRDPTNGGSSPERNTQQAILIDALIVKWGFDGSGLPKNPANIQQQSPELRRRIQEAVR